MNTRTRRVVLLVALLMCSGLSWLAYQRFHNVSLPPSGFTQAQHSIAHLSFTGDGRLLMAADSGGSGVTFWDAATGLPVRHWRGGGEQVWLAEDGRRMLEVHYNVKTKITHNILRDAITGRMLRQWTGPERVWTVSRDLSLMVTASGRYLAHLQEVATGHERGHFAVDSWMNLSFSRDAHYLCVSGWKQPSQLLRTSDLSPVLPMPPLMSVRFARDGQRVLGVARDGTLHIWQLPLRRYTAVPTGLTFALWCYELSDGALVIRGDAGSAKASRMVTQVRSPDGTRLLHSFPGWPETTSPDGQWLAFWVQPTSRHGFTPGEVAAFDILDAHTGQRVTRLDVATDALGQPTTLHSPFPNHLAIAPDDRHFAFATDDGLVLWYDLQREGGANSRAPVSTAGGREVISFNEKLFDSIVLPDGSVAASGSDNQYSGSRFVRILQSNGETQSYKAVVGNSDVSVLTASPDGKTLVGASQWGVWQLDIAQGQSRKTPLAVGSNGTQYYASHEVGRAVWPEGAQQPFAILAAAPFFQGPITLTRWSSAGTVLGIKAIVPAEQHQDDRTFSLAMMSPSPDGKRMLLAWNGSQEKNQGGQLVQAMTYDGLLEVRDTATGRLLHTLAVPHRAPMDGALGHAAWSNDGTRVAVAEQSGAVFIWNVVSGEQIGQLSVTRVHTGSTIGEFASASDTDAASCLAFTPDGRYLAACRNDGSIYLYSLQLNLPIAQLGQAATQLGWMQFAPDGHTLYGVAINGKSVQAWDVPNFPL